MNKKIFTMFTAVLLMVGALFSDAYAAGATATEKAYTASKMELKNGVKFYLGSAGNLFPVATVKLKDKSEVATFGTAAALGASTAAFEVSDYSYATSGDISTFSLKVKGQYVYAQLTGKATVAVAADAEAKDITKVFKVKGKTVAFAELYADLIGATALQANATAATAFTAEKDLDVTDLNEAKNGSFSLKYAADNLAEANIFDQKIVAIELTATAVAANAKFDGYTAGVYFAVAGFDDLKKNYAVGSTYVLDNTDGAKTAFDAATFIVLNPESNYKLDALNGDGEGFKFAKVKGEKITKANAANAVFAVNEFDGVNNAGEFRMTMTPVKDVTVDGATEIYIGAIKATPTDTKVYVTTVVAAKADKLISATFNGTSWASASTLLKKDAMNVVSIYFTSGIPSTGTDASVADKVTEFHKYLVAGAGAAAYELHALATDNVDLKSPIAQWVVAGFDGKSKFTLTNREAKTTIELTLNATTTEGVYEIIAAGTSSIANISDKVGSVTTGYGALAGKKVKFESLTTTVTDGFLNLTADQMSNGISLIFSGKNATVGEKTYYGNFTYTAEALTAYAPSLDNNGSFFTFEKAKNAEKEANYIMNEIEYAYLDKDNVVALAKDTLYVPSYKLKAADKKYLKADFTSYVDAAVTGVGEFIFRLNQNGTYSMLPVATAGAGVYASVVKYNAKATSVAVAPSLGFVFDIASLYGNNANFSDVTFAYSNDATSLKAESQHATLNSELGSISMQQSSKGFMEGILNNNGTTEAFTMWLDTADSKASVPSFYLSKGVAVTKAAEARLFMYNATDSMKRFTEGSALETVNKNYQLEGSASAKAIFRSATLISPDTLTTTVDGKAVSVVMKDASAAKAQVNGLKNYRFNIILADEEVADEYVIKSGSSYLYSLNGKLGFTSDRKAALVVTVDAGSATSNEATPEVSSVSVIAAQGQITITGAEGKRVVISNILGQVIANTVITSSNATITVPAGIVVVAIEGEAAVKAIVK